MKYTILILVVTVFMTGIILSSCQSSTKKVENARNKVIEAELGLNQALKDSIQQYKKESEEKISYYEKSIAEFKAKIANRKKEDKAIYEKKLAMLEQKNTELKKILSDYKDEGQDKWTSFKNEFNHDMDELGKAFKDLTVKNLK